MINMDSIKFQKLSQMISNRIFKLLIFPTERCNFRCSYCYENYQLGRMSSKTVDAVKKLIDRRAEDSELDALFIGWFGGEPMVAKDIMLDIAHHAKKISKDGERFIYRGSITTNGYLLSEDHVRQLLAQKINRFQISLDGPKEFHDQTRVMANGSGTFDVIWNNLIRMKSMPDDFAAVLRVHVTTKNCQSLNPFIEKIIDTFGGDSRFSLFFKAIENLGGRGETFQVFENSKQKKSHIDALHELVGDRMSVMKRDLRYDDFTVCYAAEANALAIRSDGSILKCTVALDDPKNQVGRLNDDGTITFNPDKMSYWLRGLKDFDQSIFYCPLKDRKNDWRDIMCKKQGMVCDGCER